MADAIQAWLRAPSPAMAADCELTFLDRLAIDTARVLTQHAAYAAALRTAGLGVTETAPRSLAAMELQALLTEIIEEGGNK